MFEYEKVTLHWVNRLGFLVRKELQVAFRRAGHDVSPEDWAILLVLWRKGPQRPSAIADVTVKDRTTVTRLVDAMVRKGLVERKVDDKDRRGSIIAVSAQGTALKSELIPIAKSIIDRALGEIPADDIETTTRTLEAMTQNLLSGHINKGAKP
ncbi:MAG: MarR family transcriptional regulator [Pseudoruegeria sp.]